MRYGHFSHFGIFGIFDLATIVQMIQIHLYQMEGGHMRLVEKEIQHLDLR
jgi:hypothetical protein